MSSPNVSAAPAVKFHVSLHAADLDRSINFFRVLFGREPATSRASYAKFELDEPPLVLSLVPGPHAPGGALNHVGLRLPDAAALVQVQARLESAGWQTQREEGVDCCHSRQTKFWIADPEGTVWEIYFLHDGDEEEDDSDSSPHPAHDSAGAASQHAVSANGVSNAATRSIAGWQHFLAQPLPARIEHADDSLDQVQLEGTFNLKLEPAALAGFLTEMLRALRPGGQLLIHGLVADTKIDGPLPKLPGPAAVVEHVPQVAEIDRALAAAGFIGIEFTKLGERPAFVAGSVEMREMRARAIKPLPITGDCQQVVMYRGPLAAVVDERGSVYRRGERVLVSNQVAEALRSGNAAEQFAFLASRAKSNCCG